MNISYEVQAEIYNFLNENCDGDLRKDVLNEDVALNVSMKALNKMLDLTIAKYNKIDFSDIERSRGDAENCRFYKNLSECVKILCDINDKTQKLPGALIVAESLNNLKLHKNDFMYAFRMKNSLGILLYNTMYYSTMEATAYLISASVDFIREGDSLKATSSYEVNGRDNILLHNLVRFNKQAASGKISKFIHAAQETESKYKEEEVTNEATSIVSDTLEVFKNIAENLGKPENKGVLKWVAIGAAVVGFIYLAVNIIPIIQTCTYAIYRLRHKISESAAMQAEMLEMNISVLRQNGGDENVVSKQENSAKKFRNIAAKFALECDKSNRDAQNDINSDSVDSNSIII